MRRTIEAQMHLKVTNDYNLPTLIDQIKRDDQAQQKAIRISTAKSKSINDPESSLYQANYNAQNTSVLSNSKNTHAGGEDNNRLSLWSSS